MKHNAGKKRVRIWTNGAILTALAVVLFFATLAPINSYDFWWHMATGKYIIQKGDVPSVDPFTYPVTGDDPESPGRVPFIMQQYWLSQVLFYSVHGLFGFKGIIVLRALVFVAIGLAATLLAIRLDAGRGALLTLILFVLATKVAIEDSDRPQYFIYLLTFISIVVIEWATVSNRPRLVYVNIPLILIGANIHGGYIVSIVYLAVYAGMSFLEGSMRSLKKPLLITLSASLLLSYLNPTHWNAWVMAFSIKEYASQTMEYISPFNILPYVTKDAAWLSFWALAGISLPAGLYFAVNRRYARAIILLGTLGVSLLAMRFIFFFIPVGTVFGSVFIESVLLKRFKNYQVIQTVMFILVSLAILFTLWHPNRTGIKAVLHPATFPVEVTAFLKQENLPERVFSIPGWGGYLEYWLWPRYSLFDDTRLLVRQVSNDRDAILSFRPRGREALDEYGIDTVVIPAVEANTGRIIPLVNVLYDDPGWGLVYNDGFALVFVRSGKATKYKQKQYVYYEVLSEVAYWRDRKPRLAENLGKSEQLALQKLGLSP